MLKEMETTKTMHIKKPRTTRFIRGFVLPTLIAFGAVLPQFAQAQADSPGDVETAVRSVPLHGTNGLTVYKKTALKSNFMKFPANAIAVGNVGPNKGKLIGACGMFSKIMIMDPDTGEILRTYAQPDYPVHVSDDVSEAPDGTIYWSNLDVGTIGWCKPDNTSGEIEGTGFVNSICVSRDMKWLWYGACIGKDQLWRVKLGPDGVPAEGAEHELMETGGGWSNSMDACNDGYIYSPVNMYGEVRRIHPDSGEIEKIWKGLEFPSAIDVSDTTGVVYSTEFHLGNIVRIDLKRGASRVLGKFPPMTDNLAVSDDSDNPRIFGSSFVADQIMEISERGDNPRIVSKGGIHFSAISCIGNRVLIKDMGRLQDYFPREREFKAVCPINDGGYIVAAWNDRANEDISDFFGHFFKTKTNFIINGIGQSASSAY